MVMSQTSLWILVRYCDSKESNSEMIKDSLRHVEISSVLTFTELKSTIYSWLNVENNSKIVKLRQYNNNLIPFSTLLQGSTKQKPFIIEVVGIHQFCPVQKRMILPSYVNTLKAKVKDLEKRIITIENFLPEITSIHIKNIEETANRLTNCIEYINRRLEELAPPDWKVQIGYAA